MVAFGHGEVAEIRSKFGKLVESKVGNVDAVRGAELPQGEAIRGDMTQTQIWKREKRERVSLGD